MTTDLQRHYQAVLADLDAKRVTLTQELEQVETILATIRRLAGVSETQAKAVSVTPMKPSTPTTASKSITYANMSVRWAVLAYLAEGSVEPQRTGQIADALQKGGLVKEGSRFGNIVSAVIHHLKTKGEIVAVEDGLYGLTDAGRAMWAHIKASTKFRQSQQPGVGGLPFATATAR